jgi:hypothetical protein
VSFTLQPGIVGSQRTVAAATGVTAGSWHHVAATVDDEKWIRLYVDGLLVASAMHSITDCTPPLGDANRPLAIGTVYPYTSWSGNTAYSFDGKLDNVRVYAHALSAEAIARMAFGPTVTDAQITLGGATGTGGAFRAGDTAVVEWNNSGAGDANAGITAVFVDFTQFGGGVQSAVATGDVWRASYTIPAGAIDATGLNVSITVADNSRTVTTWDTGNARLDNVRPAVIGLAPSDDATAVAVDGNLVITFSENVQPGTGRIVIRAAGDGSAVETIDVDDARVVVAGAQVVIDPAALLDELAGYYVEIDGAALTDLAGNAFPGFSGPSVWNFTTGPIANLDVDGNGSADALTDGILILRYLFNPAGPWSLTDAVGTGASRTDRAAIRDHLDRGVNGLLDVDGNGRADALTDGILILRYLFAPSGQWNFVDAVGPGASRTSREAIQSYLQQYDPAIPPSSAAGASPPEAAEGQASASVVSVPDAIDGLPSPTAVADDARLELIASTTAPDCAARDAAFRQWRLAASYYHRRLQDQTLFDESEDGPFAGIRQ